jgi:VanZ family protein
VACLFLIVFLSLIPGRWQERTALPGPVEHFIAYFLTATILGLATRRRYHPAYLTIGLAILAAVMEVLQHWSPGRDPEFIGFFGSSIGALAGALCAQWFRAD